MAGQTPEGHLSLKGGFLTQLHLNNNTHTQSVESVDWTMTLVSWGGGCTNLLREQWRVGLCLDC